MGRADLLEALRNSLALAGLVVIGSLVLGGGMAFLLAHDDVPFKSWQVCWLLRHC